MFLQRVHKRSQQIMKRSSTALISGKCKSKPLAQDPTPIRMAVTKQSKKDKCCQECGEKGTHVLCWECRLVPPLWKTIWRFLNKTYYERVTQQSFWARTQRKSPPSKDSCTWLFIAVLVAAIRIQAQPEHPATDECPEKLHRDIIVYIFV